MLTGNSVKTTTTVNQETAEPSNNRNHKLNRQMSFDDRHGICLPSANFEKSSNLQEQWDKQL